MEMEKRGKKPEFVRPDPTRLVLVVKIFHTVGACDGAPANPDDKGKNVFSAVVWIDPKKQCTTPDAISLQGDPTFNQMMFFPVESPAEEVRLSVEILRQRGRRDPGSSLGVSVVGRAKIPMPASLGEMKGMVELVGMEEGRVVPKGLLAFSLELIDADTFS